ncbi:MAG: hypothetical protein WC485_05965 [Opitutaceae bacterium]
MKKTNKIPAGIPSPGAQPLPPPVPEESVQLLLRRIVEIAEQNLAQSAAARTLLHRWQLDNYTFLGVHRVGYSTGRLPQILNNPADKAHLTALGVLTPKGAERFTGCLLFPIYDLNGALADFWVVPAAAQGNARFLHNRPAAFWNIASAKGASLQYVTPNPIDAMGLKRAGIGNVMALHPGKGKPDMQGLQALGVQRLVIVAGDTSEAQIRANQLSSLLEPFKPEVITLPNSAGVADFLAKRGEKALAEAIVAATHHVPAVSVPNMQPLPDGLVLPLGNLRYTLNGLEKTKRQLKACIRVERGEKVWADTFDLNQARARKEFTRELARIFGESVERIETDLVKLTEACEVRLAQPDLVLPGSAVDPVPEGDRREAELLGKDPRLVERIIGDFRELGVVGEECNILFSYLIMTSRKMEVPLAGSFVSSIGAGKNAVTDKARDLCPVEDRFYASFLSGKALYHMPPDALRHKFIVIEEIDGMRQALHAVRMLLSSGGLTSRIASRDPASGRLQTQTKRVEGPAAMAVTGSNPNTDRETLSRFIVSSMDESREQTQAIHEHQLQAHSVEGLASEQRRKAIERRHHAFQRLLQPLRVALVQPERIVCTEDRLNSRRDFPKILLLIKSIAFLRQMQKEVKQGEGASYIEVDDYDLGLAQALICRLFGSRSLREVSQPSRDLLRVLHRMRGAGSQVVTSAGDFTFTRRELRECSGMANTSLHRCLRELEDFEFIARDTTSRRRPFRYTLEWSPQAEPDQAAVVFKDLKPDSRYIPSIFQASRPGKPQAANA